MPSYEYECESCGDRFEHVQSMRSGALRKCRECGAPRGLRRLIGPGAGVIVRGADHGPLYNIDAQREKVDPQQLHGTTAGRPTVNW